MTCPVPCPHHTVCPPEPQLGRVQFLEARPNSKAAFTGKLCTEFMGVPVHEWEEVQQILEAHTGEANPLKGLRTIMLRLGVVIL